MTDPSIVDLPRGDDDASDTEDPDFKVTPELMKEMLSGGLIELFRDKLAGLVGTSSGYTESLPAAIQDRIDYLRELDDQKAEGEDLFLTSAVEAHLQEFAELEPLMERVRSLAADIPGFWAACLLSAPLLKDVISLEEAKVLQSLAACSVKIEPFEQEMDDVSPLMKVTLEFSFAENKYFSNAVLSKSYITNFVGDIPRPIEGTEIDWKSAEVCVLETAENPEDEDPFSFFSWFTCPSPDSDEEENQDLSSDEEDGDEDASQDNLSLKARMELDLEMLQRLRLLLLDPLQAEREQTKAVQGAKVPEAPEVNALIDAIERQDFSGLPEVVQAQVQKVQDVMSSMQAVRTSWETKYLDAIRRHEAEAAAINKELLDIVSGEKEAPGVGDAAAEKWAGGTVPKGVPSFWETVFRGDPVLDKLTSGGDAEVLESLTRVEEVLSPGGYANATIWPGCEPPQTAKLIFHFAENPYFSNLTLEKSFVLARSEIIPGPGTKIEWKSEEADVTRLTEADGEPADSFFKMFSSDYEETEEHQAPEDHMQVVYWRLFEVVHRPVPYFTGEAFADSDEENDEDEEDDEEDEDEWETDDGEEDEEEEEGPAAVDVAPKA